MEMPLNLLDLVPQDATFELSGRKGVTLTLGRWSLKVRQWAVNRFTSEGLKHIFETTQVAEIAEMAFYLLKEKDVFQNFDEFLDSVISVQDQVNITKALLQTIGIGEPEIQKITDVVETQAAKAAPDPNVRRPGKKTGAKSST